MSNDTDLRFGGIARLFGALGLERLRKAHVAVVGVGGVGSWAVEALARSGLGALTLIDADEVCVTNINRQLPALQGTIGRPKVAVLAERVSAISPECRVQVEERFFTPASEEDLLAAPYTYLLDAIDPVIQKALLLDACRRRGLPVVTVGGAGGRRDGTAFRCEDLGHSGGDDLLRQVRKRLRREHGWVAAQDGRFGVPALFSAEPPRHPWADGTCRAEPEPGAERRLDCASGYGAATFVTGALGFAAAGEIVRRIALGNA
jgi:tRNA A37 threonylcarbamoyladenosine dehydratase